MSLSKNILGMNEVTNFRRKSSKRWKLNEKKSKLKYFFIAYYLCANWDLVYRYREPAAAAASGKKLADKGVHGRSRIVSLLQIIDIETTNFAKNTFQQFWTDSARIQICQMFQPSSIWRPSQFFQNAGNKEESFPFKIFTQPCAWPLQSKIPEILLESFVIQKRRD